MTLTKRVAGLESSYWVKAKEIDPPNLMAAFEFSISVMPLDIPIAIEWENSDAEVESQSRRVSQIKKSLPPIHPDFLPDESSDEWRQQQWMFHHSPEAVRLTGEINARFLDYVRPRYDVKDGGLLGVALRLYESDLDKWIEQNQYIGRQCNPEEMAGEMLAFWTIFQRKLNEADNPQDGETRNELWRQALFENEFNLYGRQMSEDDHALDNEMWERLNSDMAAGVPSGESVAAAYFCDIAARYPRK